VSGRAPVVGGERKSRLARKEQGGPEAPLDEGMLIGCLLVCERPIPEAIAPSSTAAKRDRRLVAPATLRKCFWAWLATCVGVRDGTKYRLICFH